MDNKTLISVVVNGTRKTVKVGDYVEAMYLDLADTFHSVTREGIAQTLEEVLANKQVISQPMIASFIRATNPMKFADKEQAK